MTIINFIRNECLAMNLSNIFEFLNIAQQNKNHTCIYLPGQCEACSRNRNGVKDVSIVWWDP